MNKTFTLLSLSLSLLVSACTPSQIRREAYAEKMQLWVGKSADDLIVSLGPPTRAADLSTGGRVLEYSDDRTTVSGGGTQTVYTRTYVPSSNTWVTIPQQQATPVTTQRRICRTLVQVSPANVITSVTAEGNGCR